MKVRRKNVYVREDCFHAEERGNEVHIRTHRNTIILDVHLADGTCERTEMSLATLAEWLAVGAAAKEASNRKRKSPNENKISYGCSDGADCAPSTGRDSAEPVSCIAGLDDTVELGTRFLLGCFCIAFALDFLSAEFVFFGAALVIPLIMAAVAMPLTLAVKIVKFRLDWSVLKQTMIAKIFALSGAESRLRQSVSLANPIRSVKLMEVVNPCS